MEVTEWSVLLLPIKAPTTSGKDEVEKLDEPFLFTRRLTIFMPDGDKKTVVQLHTESWPNPSKEPRWKKDKRF